MADRVLKVNYCYVTVPARTGQGARVLGALKSAGVNMLAFSGFPSGAGKAQLDIIAENMAAVRRVAAREGWKLSKVKKGFLVRGGDRVGAVHTHLSRLADEGINVTAANAVTTDNGRYAMTLWVKPKDYARATKALKAR
jgi:hypothetical protein